MTYDKDSFLAGLAVGRMLWRPPQVFFRDLIARIAVTTPPTKLTYTDGETIDYTGMVVTGYSADGIALCELPLSALTLPDKVTYAPGNPGAKIVLPEYKDSGTVTITSVGSIIETIYTALERMPNGYVDDGGIAQVIAQVTPYDGSYAANVSIYTGTGNYDGGSPLTVYVFLDYEKGDSATLRYAYYLCFRVYTNGKKYSGQPMHFQNANSEVGNIGALLFQGENQSGSTTETLATLNSAYLQPVTVSYTAKSGAVLTDSFDITVTA